MLKNTEVRFRILFIAMFISMLLVLLYLGYLISHWKGTLFYTHFG